MRQSSSSEVSVKSNILCGELSHQFSSQAGGPWNIALKAHPSRGSLRENGRSTLGSQIVSQNIPANLIIRKALVGVKLSCLEVPFLRWKVLKFLRWTNLFLSPNVFSTLLTKRLFHASHKYNLFSAFHHKMGQFRLKWKFTVQVFKWDGRFDFARLVGQPFWKVLSPLWARDIKTVSTTMFSCEVSRRLSSRFQQSFQKIRFHLSHKKALPVVVGNLFRAQLNTRSVYVSFKSWKRKGIKPKVGRPFLPRTGSSV